MKKSKKNVAWTVILSLLSIGLNSCSDDVPKRNSSSSRPPRESISSIKKDSLLSSEYKFYTSDFKNYIPFKVSISITHDSIKFNNESYYFHNDNIYTRETYLAPFVKSFKITIDTNYVKINDVYYLKTIIDPPSTFSQKIKKSELNTTEKLPTKDFNVRPPKRKEYVTVTGDTWYKVHRITNLTPTYLSSVYGQCIPGIRVKYN